MTDSPPPAYVDFLVVGGGPAGCALTSELASNDSASVMLLEAGPDYGPNSNGGWPKDLTEAFDLAESHGWGYDSGSTYADRTVEFSRARVLGGCSSHNGCAAIWGHRLDYDAWAAAGNDGWSADDLIPFFKRANEKMRVTIPGPSQITPFHQLMLEAASKAGIPLVEDLNDLDQPVGMAPSPANIVNGVRWNSAFAFLDEIRSRANLTILGNTLVDRVLLEDGQVAGVVAFQEGKSLTLRAGTVILAGGTYNSPQILLRSGIGDEHGLRGAGIFPVVSLPGVGKNLHDHPAVYLMYKGSDALKQSMNDWGESNWLPEEQTIAKLRSRLCTEAFDLHIYPECGPYADKRTAWDFTIPVACMYPKSRGRLTIRTSDQTALPIIDHNYLGDSAGHDRGVLVDGIGIGRDIAHHANAGGLLGAEIEPGPDVTSLSDLTHWVSNHVHHYFHAAGTCKMGPASDADAVVSDRGQVHGVDGLYVADCSIMPQVPRANTNIPAVVIGLRIGQWLSGSAPESIWPDSASTLLPI